VGDLYWKLHAQLPTELTANRLSWRKGLSLTGPVFTCYSVWWAFFLVLPFFLKINPERGENPTKTQKRNRLRMKTMKNANCSWGAVFCPLFPSCRLTV